MDTIQINVSKDQFINMVHSMNEADKLEIYRELKKSLLPGRFNALLDSLKTDELSMDDISKEVKIVRKKRYESGKQVL